MNCPDKIRNFAKQPSSLPVFIYDRDYLQARAELLMSQVASRNWTARYAIKANPHKEIIQLFNRAGLHFDASSDYEVDLLIDYGIDPSHISLSSQQPARDYGDLDRRGVKLVATSMHQLDMMVDAGVKNPVAVRINPPDGHGWNKRVTTGGASSSFGIWHEYLAEVLQSAVDGGLVVDRLHIHVGSGFDPSVWGGVMDGALAIIQQMPTATTLDIGGGYKVARTDDEHEADMVEITKIFEKKLNEFEQKTGRGLQLEIEPGTWLVANGGYLIAEVVDIVDTRKEGYTFLKLNTGMNDILRPTMYGAQHTFWLSGEGGAEQEYVIVGHNCESGDLLTPERDDPQTIRTVRLPHTIIGDKIIIGGAGAYCASMRARGYNSFPDAQEIII